MLTPTIFCSLTLEIYLLVFNVFIINSIHGKHLSVKLDQINPIVQAKMTLTTSSRSSTSSPPYNANANPREPLFNDPQTNPITGMGHRKSYVFNGLGPTTKAGGKHKQQTMAAKTTTLVQKYTDNAMLSEQYDVEPAAIVTAIKTSSGKVIITDPVRFINNAPLDRKQHGSGTSELMQRHDLELAVDKIRSRYGLDSSRLNPYKRKQHGPRDRHLPNQRNGNSEHGGIDRGAMLFNSPVVFQRDTNNRKQNSKNEHLDGLESIWEFLPLQPTRRTTIFPTLYNAIFNTLPEMKSNQSPTETSIHNIQRKRDGKSSSMQQVRPQHTTNIAFGTQDKSFNIHKDYVNTSMQTRHRKQQRIHADKSKLTPTDNRYPNLFSKSSSAIVSPESSPPHEMNMPESHKLPGNPTATHRDRTSSHRDPTVSRPVTRQVKRLSSTGSIVTFDVEINTDQASSRDHEHRISARNRHPKKVFPASPKSKQNDFPIGNIDVQHGNVDVMTSSINSPNVNFEQTFNSKGGAVSKIQNKKQMERSRLLGDIISNVETAPGVSAAYMNNEHIYTTSTASELSQTTANRETKSQNSQKSRGQRKSKELFSVGSEPVYTSAGKLVTFDVETSPGTDSYTNNGKINSNVFENPKSQHQLQSKQLQQQQKQQTLSRTRYTSGNPVTFNVETLATNTWPREQHVNRVETLTTNPEIHISSHNLASKAISQLSNSSFMDTRITEHPVGQHTAGSIGIPSKGIKTPDFKTLSEKATSTKSQYSTKSFNQTSMGQNAVRQNGPETKPTKSVKIRPGIANQFVQSEPNQQTLRSDNKQSTSSNKANEGGVVVITNQPSQYNNDMQTSTNNTSSVISHFKKSSLAELTRLHTILHSIMDELQNPNMSFKQKKNRQKSSIKNTPFIETQQKGHNAYKHPLSVKTLKPKQNQHITSLPSQQPSNPEQHLQHQPNNTQIQQQNQPKQHQNQIPLQHQSQQILQQPQHSQRKIQEQTTNLKPQHKQLNHDQPQRNTLNQIEQQQHQQQQQAVNPVQQYNLPEERNRVDQSNKQQKQIASSSKGHLSTRHSGNTRNNINSYTPPVTEFTFHIPPRGHGDVEMQIKGHIGNISYRN